MTATDVSDLDEIQDLYQKYCTAFDGGQSEEYANVFTEDGQFTLPDGKVLSGRDRLRHLATVASARPGHSKHFVLNLTVDIADDVATGAAHVVAVNVDGPDVDLLMAGEYHDQLIKVDDAWLFAQRVARSFEASDLIG